MSELLPAAELDCTTTASGASSLRETAAMYPTSLFVSSHAAPVEVSALHTQN
jgi:hypothetical protein